MRLCKHGLEDIISKRRDGTNFQGRSSAWLKSKCVAQQEFVIVGFTDPKGNASGKLVYAGKAGTGFSAAFLDKFYCELHRIERKNSTPEFPKGPSRRGIHWVEPSFIAEVLCRMDA